MVWAKCLWNDWRRKSINPLSKCACACFCVIDCLWQVPQLGVNFPRIFPPCFPFLLLSYPPNDKGLVRGQSEPTATTPLHPLERCLLPCLSCGWMDGWMNAKFPSAMMLTNMLGFVQPNFGLVFLDFVRFCTKLGYSVFHFLHVLLKEHYSICYACFITLGPIWSQHLFQEVATYNIDLSTQKEQFFL